MYRLVLVSSVILLVLAAACGETEGSGGVTTPTDTAGTDTTATLDTSSGDTTTPADTTATLDTQGDTTLLDTAGDTEADLAPGPDSSPADTVLVDTTPAPDTTLDIVWPDDVPIPDIPIGDGACTNSADLAALNQPGLETAVSDCVMPCIMDSDISGCSADCIQEAAGLSDACAACFGDTVKCTMDNCMMQCMTPTSDACNNCRMESCSAPFEECAGVPMMN